MDYHYPYTSESDLLAQLRLRAMLTPRVAAALDYAKRAHLLQKRDQGNAYLEEHIYSIAAGVFDRYAGDPELEDILVLGILHDVLEDDPSASPEEIEKDFGKVMRENLELLTKAPEENTSKLSQEEKRVVNIKMIDRVRSASRLPQIIRLEDRLNNLQCIKNADTPKYRRYCEETKNLFIPFARESVPLYEKIFTKELGRLEKE